MLKIYFDTKLINAEKALEDACRELKHELTNRTMKKSQLFSQLTFVEH